MSDTNYDICGHVIQNAKDIKDMQIRQACQDAMNDMESKRFDTVNKRLHWQNIAGRFTCLGMMLLCGLTWTLSNEISRLTGRVKELEDKKNVIDVEE